ncbi:hypothetical protein [Desulfobotulus sp.]|jgi:hypothetical protein|uniref:hypothetical protein n=1 Tax=Desulfobotulus sp. TaxID=1940337 RepID=UPI002A367816|nr:hypothetical protein [Desulfobotulus sp.]MDY0162849.1 hypothetical protein [Desulfobotulus sp.]
MFTDALMVVLKLDLAGEAVSIPAGNVKSWSLDLYPWGFSGRAVFMVSLEKEKDKVFDAFIDKKKIGVTFSVKPHFIPKGSTVDALQVKGLVTKKSLLREQTLERGPLEGNPLLYRVYSIDFADPAQVLWPWHRPCDLMVKKSVKDLLEAHKSADVKLTYEWDLLETVSPMLSLSLGAGDGRASFYDFVCWYVSCNNGVFTCKAEEGSYTLSSAKKAEGEPLSLDAGDIASVRVDFPETQRSKVSLLNACSENPRTQDVCDNPHGVAGLRRDILERYPLASDFTARQELEKSRFVLKEHVLSIEFSRYPMMLLDAGTLVRLKGALWETRLFTEGKTYRVCGMHLDATAQDPNPVADHSMSFNRYEMRMECRLEGKEDLGICLPDFIPPVYPFHVEGKIVSENGEEDEETYQIHEDENTSEQQYRVRIPLWEDQEVKAPFMPFVHTGHFYFPVYKNARVLVALDFQRAVIVSCLDWRAEAKIPEDTQGNRILMGLKTDSRTAISHTYENKLPVFTMERLADKDTESIVFSDGNLLIQTFEKKE